MNAIALYGFSLYPQIVSQNPCTRIRPERGAQIMVVPLASTETKGMALRLQEPHPLPMDYLSKVA